MRLLPILLLATGCAAAPTTADLVLLDGRVVTVDPALGDAEAIAMGGGRILAVGSTDEVRAFIDADTEVIELDGKLAIPGFIEGHGHFAGIGSYKLNLELMETRSWQEILAMVEAAVADAEPGDWILGRGWHQEKWDRAPADSVEGFPTHASLSAISPDNPVLLRHASGHASFVNAKAMQLAGIDAATAPPHGGEILHDAAGQPTGLLRETAQALVGRVRAEAEVRTPTEERAHLVRLFELAQAECLSKGITSFQDAGSSFEVVDTLREFAEAGELDLRMWVMLRGSNEQLAERMDDYRMVGFADDHLTVRAVKVSMDGALGARGAWLLEPYSDLPTSTGLNLVPPAEVERTAELCNEHGFQLCIHAIGDRANREVLDIYAATHDAAVDRRWRIEHAQHLNPAEVPRFAALDVIASMQGVHCTSDGPFVPARLGDQRSEEGAYVWRKLLDAGVVVTNGTDAPVEDVSPIASYYATVSRMLPDGTRFYPDQRLGRMEALETYTIRCAFAAFEDELKGSLTPGKLADVVVLDTDILACPEEDIPGTQVLYTIVGGEVRYRSGDGQP
ncbi:MAG: amidohydrolase [Planctomycetota bacterium]|nr:amidohydrolase [Planctomycetota bacterium]